MIHHHHFLVVCRIIFFCVSIAANHGRTTANEIDWENMMKKELHDKFQQILGQQVEEVMASFGKALERMDDIKKKLTPSWTPSSMNYSSVFPNHHRLHMSHLYNNNNHNNDYLHIVKQPSAERAVCLLHLAKLLVLLLILLWLLLLMRRRMIMWETFE